MEIVKTATRGATITQNLHKTGSGRGFSTTSGSGLPRPLAETYFYISMRSDMLLDTFLAVLLVM